ncbi:MAG: septum formation initiator family protein [Bacillota bacterium]
MTSDYTGNIGKSSYSRKKDYLTRKQKKKSAVIIMGIFLLIIFPVAMIISQSLRMVDINYKLELLESDLTQLESENKDMELNLSSKKSLDRLEHIARNDLGMVNANNITRLVLQPAPQESQISYASNTDNNSFLSYIWQGVRHVRAATLEQVD